MPRGYGAGCSRVDALQGPDLREPLRMASGWNHRQNARAVFTDRYPGLPLEENVLQVVLDDRVGLVGFPQKRRTVLHFETCVADLVQMIGARLSNRSPTVLLDARMQRKHDVAAISAAR